jgi:hypothetical protein
MRDVDEMPARTAPFRLPPPRARFVPDMKEARWRGGPTYAAWITRLPLLGLAAHCPH